MHQALFERAWLRILDSKHYSTDAVLDLLQAIEDMYEYNPRMMGIQVNRISSAEIWVYYSPKQLRLPRARILAQVIEGEKEVILWHASFD